MNQKWANDDALRKMAEEAIASRAVANRALEGADRLLHELLVHQTELEMQNEALRDAQAELQESEQRYRDLFDDAPVGYLVLDASSKIRAANPQARELLGPDIIGTRFSQSLVPDEALAFERYRREVLGCADRFVGEFIVLDAKGRRREIRLDGVRTNEEGTEWRATLIDVTVQNGALRKLNHSERLAAVGQHASGIAHDLSNLLYSIAVHTDVALASLTAPDPARSALVQLRRVVERCASATAQLASYSRSEIEQAGIVDLNGAISNAEIVLKSMLGDDIELELELAAVDASVRMDVSDIEQILLSAVRNAKHAMPHGGTFRVETGSVVLKGVPEDARAISARYVRWTMTDTGVGMSEQTRRHAFEPFYTTKPAGSGTGLGLSLVNAVVERLGGAALLESELGRGTSLVLHLPCASASASISSRPAPPPSSG
jgi:PAS domain S-box-containing protein